MSKPFTTAKELPIVSFDWGDIGMRLEPHASGCNSMVVMDVALEPGGMHNFHKHVDQDEIIICLSGKVEQWVGTNKTILNAGDSAYIPKNTVHASFNDFSERAQLQVVLAAASGPTGYELVDVVEEEPWKSIRGKS
jgi:quercetin dioxygenase-like cupin family protein